MVLRKLLLSFLVVISFLAQNLGAKDIKVGLEPFPPLINEDGTGYSINFLRALEKVSDLKFNITIVPYSRAKFGLEKGDFDIIGHTPYQNETKEFYVFAQDLPWSLGAVVDIYGTSPDTISAEKFKTLKMIGVPLGNKEFFAEILGIPQASFYEGTLETLAKMLPLGRIDALIFSRAATMATFKKLQIKGINYRLLDDSVQAGFALRKDKDGTDLLEQLKIIMTKVDQKSIFKDYSNFLTMAKSGVLN